MGRLLATAKSRSIQLSSNGDADIANPRCRPGFRIDSTRTRSTILGRARLQLGRQILRVVWAVRRLDYRWHKSIHEVSDADLSVIAPVSFAGQQAAQGKIDADVLDTPALRVRRHNTV
jgi:hypothetical protein